MIEVHHNLFVGDATDEASVRGAAGWYVVSAAKEPWHRQALGYTQRAAPKDHPEYLWARRENRLILNLVDVADPAYIRPEIVEIALAAIHTALEKDGQKVLVHCNQGGSRGPTIAMLYLQRHTDEFAGLDYEAAAEQFRSIYPSYAPARGVAEYARANWG
jgi:predicted protein tyrosine phosphatase